jgi:transposase InsO family protein
VKYACIARYHRPKGATAAPVETSEFDVRLMCRVLAVRPSGYYAWRKRGPAGRTARAIADERLLLNIRVVHRQSHATYGAPRVHHELRDQGERVGKKRIARLMRQHGLVGRRPRRWVRTTDSAHPHPIAPNVLNRQFDVNGIRVLNRAWVADITYVPTLDGFLYLAVILDLASRRVVGWAMRDTLAAEVALAALRMALDDRRPAPGLVHHSDRGGQYACTAYQEVLATHGLEASMSRKGDCWDNAVAESFFATLECELIARHRWTTRAEARQAIFRYLATWYNPTRRHSTLGYQSPAAYERELERGLPEEGVDAAA